MYKYIITDGKYYIARNYIGDYKAIDYITPLVGVFGGRIQASQAIIFDSPQNAIKYLKRNGDMNQNVWKIQKYNIGMNCLEDE